MIRYQPADRGGAATIAVVEDDPDLLENTVEFLQNSGYPTWGAGSAEAFRQRLSLDPVDVVVLDIGLPDEDGIAVSRSLSGRSDIAVIIVSARAALLDRLAGMHAGADRYLVKPVNFAELLANIDAVVRRHAGHEKSAPAAGATAPDAEPARTADSGPVPADSRDRSGAWRLALTDWCLTAPNGLSTSLTTREFAVMRLLFEADSKPVSRQNILRKIYGARTLRTSAPLDVALARLRKKVRLALDCDLPVKTIHGYGFAFTAPSLLT